MGYEPFFDAMNANPDFNIIIGGRAYDPSPYVAFCVYQLTRQSNHLSTEELHSRLGGFYHMGKILECGGQCSFPKSHGAVATVYENGLFDVRPTDPESMCTPLSVAAHTLYENTRPDVLRGPGGSLHLDNSKYEQLSDGKSVRVSGSVYLSSEADGKPYQLKLEAARIVGYRSMFMGSITDRKKPLSPTYEIILTLIDILVSQIDKLLARVKVYVDQQHPEIAGQWNLDFHVYGKDQYTHAGLGQLFIVAEALAPTQQLANSIASKARVGMIVSPPMYHQAKLMRDSMHHIQGRKRLQATLASALVALWRLNLVLVLSSLCTISWTLCRVKRDWPWVVMGLCSKARC